MTAKPQSEKREPARRMPAAGGQIAPTHRQRHQRRAREHIGRGMPDSRGMSSITIRHKDGQLDRLAAIALTRETSLACVIREAIDVYLERKGN